MKFNPQLSVEPLFTEAAEILAYPCASRGMLTDPETQFAIGT